MAITTTKAVTESFDTNVTDNGGGLQLLAAVNNANPAAARAIAPRKLTFSWEGTTTGSETAVIANSICTLAALGVTFPLNTMRQVRVKAWSRSATAGEAGYVERVFAFRGAATVGAATLVADGTTLATAFTVAVAQANIAANFGMPQAAVDGTAGPFITVWNAATGTLTTSATANIRWRVEIEVEPLIALGTF